MQIAKDVYKLSGVDMQTNSSSYVIDAGDQLILIDAGFTDFQWEQMMEMLKFWELDKKPITYTFLTHCHFDHAGNAWKAGELGSKIFAGPIDAEAIETGSKLCIGYMFGKEFKPCKIDKVIEDGEFFQIGSVELKALHVPGHSSGSMIFTVKIHGKTLLFLGDFLAIEPHAPEDAVNVLLAWTGGPDYSGESYLESLKKASELEADVLCTGHYYVNYLGCKNILRMAYEKGRREINSCFGSLQPRWVEMR